MKNIISALVLSTFLVGTASADQNKSKQGPDIDQLVPSLQLDAAKADSLKSLMESHREKRQASREQGNKDREQRQALRKEHRKALLDLLGYEKMYEFEEIMRENRSKGGKRSKHKHNEK